MPSLKGGGGIVLEPLLNVASYQKTKPKFHGMTVTAKSLCPLVIILCKVRGGSCCKTCMMGSFRLFECLFN